jgi:hypothetical protein
MKLKTESLNKTNFPIESFEGINMQNNVFLRGRDIAVSMVSLDVSGFEPQWENRVFSPSHSFTLAMAFIKPPIQWESCVLSG